MTTQEILHTIEQFRQSHAEEFGIVRIGVFGSVARGEEHSQSDVDVVVEMSKPDLFALIGIQQELSDLLDRPVDLVRYREGMNAFLKKRIERDAIYV